MERAHLLPVQQSKLLSHLWFLSPPDDSILDGMKLTTTILSGGRRDRDSHWVEAGRGAGAAASFESGEEGPGAGRSNLDDDDDDKKCIQSGQLTWMAWWSRWCARQREQSAPFMQSRQYMLHSLLCASAWILHWTKKLVDSSGFSHGGHRWFSAPSSHSPPPCGRTPRARIQSNIAIETNQEPGNRAAEQPPPSQLLTMAPLLFSPRGVA